MINFMRGFVLPTVLVFLHLFSMLALSQLTTVAMLFKSRLHANQKNEFLMSANQILKQLENTISEGMIVCGIPEMAAAEFVKKPLSWWQSNTCHGNLYGIRYYYAVETLGSDSCAIVYTINTNHKLIANFYRITLFALQEKAKGGKILLQSTLVKAIDEISPCREKPHKVMIGRQMWRRI